MMFIVVSSQKQIAHEAKIINQLFDEGMPLFHLRKPEYSEKEICELMEGIDSKHYSKLVFHQFHELANKFSIIRLHFTETNRKNQHVAIFSELKKENFVLSTSVHSVDDFENLEHEFEYAFLGPIFDSISKKEYKAKKFTKNLSNKIEKSTKLIGIGGITATNLHQAIEMGFNGIALLGTIWESENPVQEFKQIKNEFSKCEILH